MTRTRQTQRDPELSPTLTLRTQRSFKHRFSFDDEENAELSTPSKRPKFRELVAFNPFGHRQRDTKDHVLGEHERRHSQGESGSSVPTELQDLQDSYGNLSLTLHSAAVSQLEAAQEEVTREVVGGIKEQQQRVARRAAAHDQLAASVLSARASKTATSPGGRSQSTEIVDMAVAATVFDDELCAATTEFARLRAEWEDACAEIEAVGRELQAYQGLDADVELGKGSTAQQPSREIEEMESEHGAAVAEFREELETLSVDAVAEYKSYEKEFLKKIEAEAGKVMQSIVHSGF